MMVGLLAAGRCKLYSQSAIIDRYPCDEPVTRVLHGFFTQACHRGDLVHGILGIRPPVRGLGEARTPKGRMDQQTPASIAEPG